MPSDSVWSRFDTITLAEMNATARMMTRVDRKYLLSTAEATMLVDALPAGTRILTVNGQFWQHYRTSYLDSSRWGSYHTPPTNVAAATRYACVITLTPASRSWK